PLSLKNWAAKFRTKISPNSSLKSPSSKRPIPLRSRKRLRPRSKGAPVPEVGFTTHLLIRDTGGDLSKGWQSSEALPKMRCSNSSCRTRTLSLAKARNMANVSLASRAARANRPLQATAKTRPHLSARVVRLHGTGHGDLLVTHTLSPPSGNHRFVHLARPVRR